jgi:hypothetical protein
MPFLQWSHMAEMDGAGNHRRNPGCLPADMGIWTEADTKPDAGGHEN